MKFLSLVLASSLLFACGHKPIPVSFETPKDNSIYLNASDRAPAQAPEIAWEPASATITITGNGLQTGTVSTQKVMTWTELVPFTDVRLVEKDVLVVGTCTKYVCTGKTGNATAWKAVTTGTRTQRVEALSKVVKGFGPVSSKSLIEAGYFQTMPKSWDDFVRIVDQAASRGVIRKTEATKVKETYQVENMQALGYNQSNCEQKLQGYTCEKWVTKMVQENFTNHRKEIRKKVIETRKYLINADVRDTLLLPTETDRLTLKIDEAGRVSHWADSTFNRYALMAQAPINHANGTVELNFTLTGNRIQIDLPKKVIRDDSYQIVGGQPTFTLDVDSSYILNQVDPEAQLVLDYEVQICEYGWTGTCGVSSWKVLEKKQVVITNARTVIQPTIPSKHKSQIRYNLSQKASKFYNDEPTRTYETDEIKTAK